jgi:hypothetical protein
VVKRWCRTWLAQRSPAAGKSRGRAALGGRALAAGASVTDPHRITSPPPPTSCGSPTAARDGASGQHEQLMAGSPATSPLASSGRRVWAARTTAR